MPPAPSADCTSYEPTRVPGPSESGKGFARIIDDPGQGPPDNDDAIIGARRDPMITATLLMAALACERLTTLTLPNVTITAAQPVAAGGRPDSPNLPAFCRVAATLKPSSDSDIKMELWMPSENWNGKFQEVGNGAFNGSIGEAAMAGALRRGYATAS